MRRDAINYLPPTLLSLGLLLYLSLWIVYQFLAAYNQSVKERRSMADAIVRVLRGVVVRELKQPSPRLETLRGVLDEIVAETNVEGVVIRRGDRAVVVAGGLDDPPEKVNGKGERGHAVEGLRLWTWSVFRPGDRAGSESQRGGARGKSPPYKIILVMNARSNLRGLGLEGRLLLINFILGVGGVVALFLAWNYSLRYRELQSRLKTASDRREQMEEVGLAAAGLAHETKNPLGLIRGIAQQITKDEGNSENARRMAREIMEEADVTTARLGDFLSYARVRKPTLTPVDAEELFAKVERLVADDFTQKNVTLNMVARGLTIMADQEMLAQVILNLLMNSLHSTEAGDEVTVMLRKTGGGRASLSVRDTGAGVDPDLLPNMFKPYVTKRAEGFGMGLAIVKRIVEQSGWRVRVKSKPGQGAEVFVEDIQS